MSRTSIIISCILISIFLINFSSTSLLLIDRKNPCRAYGNASVYDITNLVKTWPITLNGPGFGGEYTYYWSCAGRTGICEDTDVAVCQQRTEELVPRWNAGNVSPQLWFGLFNGPAVHADLTWDIVYPNHQSDPELIYGTGIRVTVIHFIVDPNVEKPIITVDGELKYTEYSITVRGKCIGQPAINQTSFVQGYCDPQTGKIVPGPNMDEIQRKIFFVSDYGAYPNDHLDDTNEIQLAINQAINYGLNSGIIFGFGIYNISSTISISNATNFTITGQGIDQTFLIGSNPASMFFAQYCQGLKMTSFSIDFNPLPFTAGHVVNVDDKYLDVRVLPPHQTDIDRQVTAILRYDPVQMRPAFGPNTYEIYQTPPTDSNTTVISPGILRIPLKSPTQFLKGDPIVARYGSGNHAMVGQDVIDFTIQSITIYTSWSMGFVTLRAKRLNVINYHVIPYNGRWMSSTADCMHFADTREYVSILDSKCQAMGDDGLNVHAFFFPVTQIINSSAIIIQLSVWTDRLNVGVGTNLEFSSNHQPYSVHASGTVASIVFNSTNSRIFTFTSPVNASVGDWACVGDTPLLTIRNFTVSHNRARGVLLETRNIDIRQSVFNRTSGPAVLIQPSMYWGEGPEARNVSLIENIYINNNEGIAQTKGIITILPDPIQLVQAINDIRIESSTFYFGMYSQGLLQCDNTNNLFISENYIATNSSTPLISICNSRNISAENNCVVNQQTKIDEYYTFDQSNPCSMNLSSVIDLPPSAFNSSFPPPVTIKD